MLARSVCFIASASIFADKDTKTPITAQVHNGSQPKKHIVMHVKDTEETYDNACYHAYMTKS